MKKDEFKVGDTVYCTMYGEGFIEHIDENGDYPVSVAFKNGAIKSYTKHGRFYAEVNRTLFFEEIPIPESAYVRPKWRAEKGGKYFLINSTGDIYNTTDNYYEINGLHFKTGNYFKSEEVAKQSKFYKVFHEVRECER